LVSCCSSLAASLRHRVTIQTVSRAVDGQGGFTETWVDGDSAYAGITPLKGYQRFQAMQMQTPVTHRVVTRYRADLTTGTRLKFGTRVFWVKEVINVDEQNRFLEIRAEERVSASADDEASFGQLDFSSANNSALAAAVM